MRRTWVALALVWPSIAAAQPSEAGREPAVEQVEETVPEPDETSAAHALDAPADAVPLPAAPSAYAPGFEAPDPRVEAILLRAQQLAEEGNGTAVLDHLEEVADHPVCPPMLWDLDIHNAAVNGIESLPVPEDRRVNLFIGIPFLAVGLGGGLVTTLIYGLAAGLASALGGSGSIDLTPLAIAWGIGGGLAVTGAGIMLSSISPVADAFRARQHELIRRIAPPERRLPLEAEFMAFGHPECPGMAVVTRAP
jgi:hypothetical protein